MILKIDSGVFSISLDSLYKYVSWDPGVERYFLLPPGQNHVFLLAYLSSQLPDGAKVADLGTFNGHSALGLSYNDKVSVTTFDIDDRMANVSFSYKSKPNIQFVKIDCKMILSMLVDSHIIFLDIAPHNGADERNIVNELTWMGYRGLLICDDINWNDSMRSFWSDIQLRKFDITGFGHWSGTGVIVFDKNFIDVSVS